MENKIKLSEIVNELEMQSEEISCFFSKKTGEFYGISHEDFEAAESGHSLGSYPEWQHKSIQIALDIIDNMHDYIKLPSQFDIDEYRIMEKFCFVVEDKKISESLYNAIKGKGAFRRFKDSIHEFGIADI
jgi:hypothetical protein